MVLEHPRAVVWLPRSQQARHTKFCLSGSHIWVLVLTFVLRGNLAMMLTYLEKEPPPGRDGVLVTAGTQDHLEAWS